MKLAEGTTAAISLFSSRVESSSGLPRTTASLFLPRSQKRNKTDETNGRFFLLSPERTCCGTKKNNLSLKWANFLDFWVGFELFHSINFCAPPPHTHTHMLWALMPFFASRFQSFGTHSHTHIHHPPSHSHIHARSHLNTKLGAISFISRGKTLNSLFQTRFSSNRWKLSQ